MIRELEDLNMSLEDEINSNNSLDNKALTSKKKQIELLMKIDGVGEELAEDYEYSKTNLHQKLRENVEILKLYLESLKGNKGEEVLKNIKEIRKAAKIVLQCSRIIEGA
jgi:predicted CopG family antitoxin